MSSSAELEQLDVLDGLLTRTREALGSVLGPESRLLPLDVAAQRLVDRASTSYREGYEARIAEEKRVGVVLVSEKPVLASNPLDPKCASIFEAAEMMADMSAAMRKMANALGEALESRRHYRQTAWEQDAQLADLKRQLGETQETLGRTTERAEKAEKESDNWRATVAAMRAAP